MDPQTDLELTKVIFCENPRSLRVKDLIAAPELLNEVRLKSKRENCPGESRAAEAERHFALACRKSVAMSATLASSAVLATKLSISSRLSSNSRSNWPASMRPWAIFTVSG